MKGMQVHSPQSRLRVRLLGEARARMALVQLICIVSILRTALTRLVPLSGSAAWWLIPLCLLPGMVVYGLLVLAMRLTGTTALDSLVRSCLGRVGGWWLSLLLGALTLLDGVASMTALVTLFTEGVGTRGTQFTLALLTGAVLLACLNREGLARGVYLLRRVMLGAALLIGLLGLSSVQGDCLFPPLGDGRAALLSAFRAGMSLAWPLTLLLTLPPAEKMQRVRGVCPVVLVVVATLLFVCLTHPHELLIRFQALADCLLLPTRYASSAVRTLAQCLLMLLLFLSVGGTAQLATDDFCAPVGQTPRWLPYAVLALLTATQVLPPEKLWRVLEEISVWMLLPLGVTALLCLLLAILRRKKG